MDPVVINVTPPGTKFKIPKIPERFTNSTTKLLTLGAAILIIISALIVVVFSVVTNDKGFKESHGITTPGSLPNTAGSTETTKSSAALPGGGIAIGTGGTTGTNSPVITLTANPASVSLGGTAVLKWSVTNNPKSCVASEDWGGNKASSGQETTQRMTKVQTYLYTLTCKTDTGTGFSTVSVSTIQQGGTGGVGKPVVTLAANPSSIYINDNSTLTWSATNSPTSCTSSGDWSGTQSASGAASTGKLGSARTYTYTLTCKNSSGSGFATTTVAAVNPPPDIPITTVSTNPVGPVTPGTSVTITWTATNNPSTCTASGDWSGVKSASGSQSSGSLNTIRTYTYQLNCSNSAGSTFDSAAVLVLPDAPAVSLTVNPSTITTGNSSTISWSATNNPTSCTASSSNNSWTGAKTATTNTSTANTGVINTPGRYTYSLSCTNQGGTTTVSNVPLTVNNPAAPVVTISASPSSITAGGSSTINWSVSNSPTSCTASGSWSGSKTFSGSQNTGAIGSGGTYSYTLACSNGGGTGSSTATLNVTGGSSSAPVVTISASPSSIGTGSSSTISWSVTNSPTTCTASGSWSGTKASSGSQSTGAMAAAGTYTYTLSCSNASGSNQNSTTLTVIAAPVVTISTSPSSISTGASSTITWSATNSPSSCTASGSWSGSKAASGSQNTGAMGSAGSFTYTLSCNNGGGSGSKSATLTVTAAAVYCGGQTPCYGPNDLASHAAVGNCWSWNAVGSAVPWVINITSFRPNHPGGIKSGSSSTIENASATCNHDIHNILTGGSGIPGYTDSKGNTTHGHASSTDNNSSGSALTSYRVGYYDATKP